MYIYVAVGFTGTLEVYYGTRSGPRGDADASERAGAGERSGLSVGEQVQARSHLADHPVNALNKPLPFHLHPRRQLVSVHCTDRKALPTPPALPV